MREELTELLFHAVVALGYAVVALVTAGAGVMFEYRSYLFLTSGETMLAAWMGGLGIVLLAFASLVVRDKLAVAFSDIGV